LGLSSHVRRDRLSKGREPVDLKVLQLKYLLSLFLAFVDFETIFATALAGDLNGHALSGTEHLRVFNHPRRRHIIRGVHAEKSVANETPKQQPVEPAVHTLLADLFHLLEETGHLKAGEINQFKAMIKRAEAEADADAKPKTATVEETALKKERCTQS